MTSLNQSLEKHHKPIIYTLTIMLAFFAIACTFDAAIPVCHYLFGCDHAMHLAIG